MAANTKGFKKRTLVLGLLAAGGLFSMQVQADQLADIKAAGVVKVATFDANPPFGSIDAKTHEIVGYDVDFARALASALGVKLVAGVLGLGPVKAIFKILPVLLSNVEIGVGVKKGETALLKAVNDELVNLEKNGQAAKIYDVWFGPDTPSPQPRAFKIEAQ